MQTPEDHARTLTVLADVISAGAIVGAFMKELPEWAAGAAFLWYIVQVWESHTVQKWWRLHRLGRKTATPKRKRKNRIASQAKRVLATIGSATSDIGA